MTDTIWIRNAGKWKAAQAKVSKTEPAGTKSYWGLVMEAYLADGGTVIKAGLDEDASD